MTINVLIDYAPRKYQWKIHKSLKRFNVLVCHRRFGKSVMLINELIAKAINSPTNDGRFHFFAPSYKQAKEIIWDYLKLYSKDIPGISYNEVELRADFPNGSRVKLYGTLEPDAVRGIYSDGVVFDEYQDTNPKIWTEVIRPAISDRKGFVIFSGTPKGNNHFYDIHKYAEGRDDWFSCVYKVSETKIIDDEELRLNREIMSPDEYNQEYECSFEAAIKGSYYADQMHKATKDGRIRTVPYDEALEVHTVWDLGINDAMAIWFFQTHGSEIRLIDYYENSGEGFNHYIKVLREKDYLYGRHWAPHDISVKELGTGISRLERAKELGLDFDVVQKLHGDYINSGIDKVRTILSRCYFDKDKCEQGISCLKHYRKEWDEKRQTYKTHPLHDWSSNGADAFRYLAQIVDNAAEKKVEDLKYNVDWVV